MTSVDDEKLEKLVEKKVEERLEERLNDENKKKKIIKEKKITGKVREQKEISRRSFLKKAGVASAGLGAIGLASASGLKLTKNGIFQNDKEVSKNTEVIDSANRTSYTTNGEDAIYADTSNGPVTVTLGTTDTTQGNKIDIVNISGANSVTVDTEGSETIDPGGEASKAVANAGWSLSFISDGSNWDASTEGEFGSLSTANLDVTDEVLIEVEKTSSQSYNTANGRVTVTWDNKVTDVTSDFDLANNQFSPPETGHYRISAEITVNSFSDGDRLIGVFRNVTDNKDFINVEQGASNTETHSIVLTGERKLDSSKSYEIQYLNLNSDDNIVGAPRKTFCTISKSMIR